MKSYTTLIFFLILLASCNSNKNPKTPTKKENLEIKNEPQDSAPKMIDLTLSTGKSIRILIDKKTNSSMDLKIIPYDFENSKDTFHLKDIDPLKKSLVLDLDQNGYDEIYLITAGSGSGSYGNIYGFASNQDLSLTSIYIPEISEPQLEADGDFFGYMGHDSIYTDEKRIYRKFPIYKEGDPNCCPTGGAKTLAYQLKAGEASWKLEFE